MSISMSDAKVDDSERTAIKNLSHEVSVSEVNSTNVVGITTEFEKNLHTAIDTYMSPVNVAIGEMCSPVSSGAFKGTLISSSIEQFVSAVKEVAESYSNKLASAEKEIITNVRNAYSSQDVTAGGKLNVATGALNSDLSE